MASLLGAAVFTVCMISSWYLRQHQAFNQENIIFDADPYFRSFAFAEGWGERSLMHPNLSNYVNPVVRVVERVVRPFYSGVSPSELRMRLSLGIGPLSAALTTMIIFLIAKLAMVDGTEAFALAVVFGFSMSTIAFGSVPDHFIISAFLCSVGALLLQIDSHLNQKWRLILWNLVVTAAAGITLSNAIPLLMLFGIAVWLRVRDWIKMARAMALATTVVTLLTFFSWIGLNWVYGDFSSLHKDQIHTRNVGRVLAYITDNPLRDLISFPINLGRGFWTGKPDLDKNPPYPNPAIAKYDVAFGLQAPLKQPWLNTVLQLLPTALVVFSLVVWLRERRAETFPVMVSAGIFIGFNWALHSVWGGFMEVVLFSPHWHFASVLALIPLAQASSMRFGSPLFLAGAGLVATLNLTVWYNALMLLPSLAKG